MIRIRFTDKLYALQQKYNNEVYDLNYDGLFFTVDLFQVRRAAAKCLESVISTRHELLDEMYKTVSPALIARFKGIPVFFYVFLWFFVA